MHRRTVKQNDDETRSQQWENYYLKQGWQEGFTVGISDQKPEGNEETSCSYNWGKSIPGRNKRKHRNADAWHIPRTAEAGGRWGLGERKG